ncbi:GNAT family N-acetyltransferase [Fluviicola taffensis]|uniref:GCN5-related N-acetyltransferase n=1 Tax=Fluviicola taffensis (strain DSM 16823 / NCIMB 13979 / RW262) TaxID=755732 RepID=F2IIB5_FLUTR|nr:GNAT family N-acetyltransferase [Fluviicola taffensis]AEA43824.1 GCN5-related N-acetyltransferase [Fluviicola taffensis DSM 16823]
MTIREAKLGDEQAIHGLICELALYEKAPDEVTNTVEKLAIDLFTDRVCEALVIENEDSEIVGFALYYLSYSTWKGRCLYLEDFYVQPDFRRGGIGSSLFLRVVEIAKSWDAKRMDWQVLDWNEPAIEFYKKHQAVLDPEWVNGRLFF